MSMIEASPTRAALLVLVGLALVLLWQVTVTVIGLVIGVLLFLAVLYLVYIIAARLHDKWRYGQPVVRRGGDA